MVLAVNYSTPLINTPLQRGDRRTHNDGNRFNGFSGGLETAEAVDDTHSPANTPLKRGANEIEFSSLVAGATFFP